MKKYILKGTSVITAFLMLFVQTQVFATPSKVAVDLPSIDVSVFQLDEANLNLALNELNELESYLNLHVGVTYDDVIKNASQLVLNVSATPAPSGDNKDPLGIPSFLWGCVLGWVGIVLVYIFTDKDKEETKKALKGCITGVVVVIGVQLVFIAVGVAGTTSQTYYYN